ncbi:MAG TPA: exodeoxyribonuclease VII large subunit [Tepidisphaeraceae bacterium]|jgi:exodeoxyribonuclease VII large subunit
MSESFFAFQKRMTVARAAKPAAAATTTDAKPLSVAELTARIDAVLRGGLPQQVLVRGEISNLNHHRGSGHLYFTLKDDRACLDCVMFRGEVERLTVRPDDGDEVLVEGGVRVYAQRGRYQLYATRITPLGRGALEARFRALQVQLQAEGLFDAGRKRRLPAFPRRITLVTSRQAAAFADMAKVFSRYRFLDLRLIHVAVQGEAAAPQIAAALGRVRERDCDLIVLARGGGSLEDLWAFNEEIVARAIVAAKVPVVTGIGHEVDVSIADLVADYHAHTPTEAAQVVVAAWKQAAGALDAAAARLHRAAQQHVADARLRLCSVDRHEFFRRPADRVNRLRELLDDRERQLHAALAARAQLGHRRLSHVQIRLAAQHPLARVRLASQRLSSVAQMLRHRAAARIDHEKCCVESAEKQLVAFSPQRVLARGYSMTSLKRGGVLVRSAKDVRAGDVLVTRFSDGSVESVAKDTKQGELF